MVLATSGLLLAGCGPDDSGADPGPSSSESTGGSNGSGTDEPTEVDTGFPDEKEPTGPEEPTEVDTGFPDEEEPTGPEEPTEVETGLPKP